MSSITPPLGYVNANGQTLGVHWDYLAAIERESSLCINKKLLPYPRIWKSIKTGAHDGGIVFRSAERSGLVTYVRLIRSVKTIVVFATGRSGPLQLDT